LLSSIIKEEEFADQLTEIGLNIIAPTNQAGGILIHFYFSFWDLWWVS